MPTVLIPACYFPKKACPPRPSCTNAPPAPVCMHAHLCCTLFCSSHSLAPQHALRPLQHLHGPLNRVGYRSRRRRRFAAHRGQSTHARRDGGTDRTGRRGEALGILCDTHRPSEICLLVLGHGTRGHERRWQRWGQVRESARFGRAGDWVLCLPVVCCVSDWKKQRKWLALAGRCWVFRGASAAAPALAAAGGGRGAN